MRHLLFFFITLTLSQAGFAMDPNSEETSPSSHRRPKTTVAIEDLMPLVSFIARFGNSVPFTEEIDKLEVLTLAYGFAKHFKSINDKRLTGGDNIVFLINRLNKLKENRHTVCRATKVLMTDEMTEHNVTNLLSAVGDLEGDYVDKCQAVKSLVTPEMNADDICILLMNIDFWGPNFKMIAAVAQRIISPDMNLYDVRQSIQQVRAMDDNLLCLLSNTMKKTELNVNETLLRVVKLWESSKDLCKEAFPLLTADMDVSEFEQIIESKKQSSVE